MERIASSSAPSSYRVRHSGFLFVEKLELVVDVGIAALRLRGLLEKRLADHGEEFRGILRRIGIEPGLLAAVDRVAEAFVRFLEGGSPRGAVHAGVQRRQPIGGPVQ